MASFLAKLQRTVESVFSEFVEPPVDAARSSAASPTRPTDGQELCRFNDQCARSDCHYHHTSGALCPSFPKPCTEFAMCASRHPVVGTPEKTEQATDRVQCKFSDACSRLDCKFSHPGGILCRYSDKCRSLSEGTVCPYRHLSRSAETPPVIALKTSPMKPAYTKDNAKRPANEPSPPKPKAKASPEPSPGKSAGADVAKCVVERQRLLANHTSHFAGGACARFVYVDMDNIWVSFDNAEHLVARFPGAAKRRDLELNLEVFTRRLAQGDGNSSVERLVAFYYHTPKFIADKLASCSHQGVSWDVRKQETTSDTSMQLELLSARMPCAPDQAKTLVLVTGDGNVAPNGMCFREIMDKYLRDGWFVEVHAWLATMATSYIEFQKHYPVNVVIRPFDDDDVGDIVRLRGSGRPGYANPQTAVRGDIDNALSAETKVSVPAACGAFVPGIVDSYDDTRGFGFIRRSPASEKVYFVASVVVDGSSGSLKPGDAVVFKAMASAAGGTIATTVRRVEEPKAKQVNPVQAAIPGVVVEYKPVGGHGLIIKLDGSAEPELRFRLEECDIKRPAPQPGERVMVQESMGPKGPRASIVSRINMKATPSEPPASRSPPKPKAKSPPKPAPKTKNKPPAQADPSPADLSAMMRALLTASQSTQPSPPMPIHTEAAMELQPDQYKTMIQNLLSVSRLYVPAGLAMLAQTRPQAALAIQCEVDGETQASLLIIELGKELNTALHRSAVQQPALNHEDQLAADASASELEGKRSV